MRFCLVTTFYPPYHHGGDGVFVQDLARALARRGHHVQVVHCEDAYRLHGKPGVAPESTVDADGVRVHGIRSRWGPLSPLFTQQTGLPGPKRAALEAVLAQDFDVVNYHNISLIGGPGVLGMSRAPVTLYTLHEHWLICPMHILWKNRQKACDRPQCLRCSIRSNRPPQLWRYTGLRERSLEHVDALLAPSEYTALRHRSETSAPIHVLPSFTSFDPGPAPFRAGSGRPRFLFVGRVTASKGISELVEQFAGWPEVELRVVGSGDLLESLQKRFGNVAHVRFLGWQPREELVHEYRGAHAVVLPSLAPEVFPLCVLEAFACGTPAIVRDAGGSREAVERTGAGFVYSRADELEEAVATLARDDGLRAKLGERARKGYEAFYSEPRYVDRYLALIEDIGRERVRA